MEVIQLKCPSCTAAVSSADKICQYCEQPVMVSSFRTVAAMPMPMVNKYANSYRQTLIEHPDNVGVNTSLGICFLRLKQYQKALEAFEKAMPENFEDPEPFFLAAICLLQGKKAFLTPRSAIDQALGYLDSAAMIEMRPVFYAMKAYLKADYYERKCLNVSPAWQEELDTAKEYGLGEADVIELFDLLGVARPDYI